MNPTIKTTAEPYQEYSVQEFVDLILNDVDAIRSHYPYISAVILSIVIEILGKCLLETSLSDKSTETDKCFKEAIDKCASLKKYSVLDYKEGTKLKNKLYTFLRCGLAHSLTTGSLKLKDDKNDLNNNVIGCAELFSDVKSAWEQIVNKSAEINAKMDLAQKCFYIDSSTSTSGTTQSHSTITI